MEEKKAIKIIKWATFGTGTLFLYLSLNDSTSNTFTWGMPVGLTFLFIGIFASQVTTISKYRIELNSNSENNKYVKIFCYLGILQVILVLLSGLVILSLFLYLFASSRSLESMRKEFLNIKSSGIILIILGGWMTLSTIQFIIGYYTLNNPNEKYSSADKLINLRKIIGLGLSGIFILIIGVIFLFL
ncbi:MAG: hypothetical protein ACR2N3_10185 [Pyrinomonadaceae bacterium]